MTEAISDQHPPTLPPVAGGETAAPFPGTKTPLVAGFLSLFPGIGNIYNGLYLRGLTFFLIIGGLMLLAQEREEFGFAVAFFWIFNVVDSWRQATLINYGYAQDLGITDLPERPKAGQGGILAGAILLLIGLIAFLERFLHIDLDWMIELWPIALMLIGAWMIWASVRERMKEREAEPSEELEI